LVASLPNLKQGQSDYYCPTSTDEGLKAASYLVDTFRDPEAIASQDPSASAFNRAFKVPMPFFEWCELSDNERQFRRFGAAMKGSTKAAGPDTALSGLILLLADHTNPTDR